MRETDELWASDEWIETGFDKHEWMKKNRSEMNENSPSRWFVIKNAQWPLVCVSVYHNYPTPPAGTRISVSYKTEPDGWFQDCSLPQFLTPVLIEMLKGELS